MHVTLVPAIQESKFISTTDIIVDSTDKNSSSGESETEEVVSEVKEVESLELVVEKETSTTGIPLSVDSKPELPLDYQSSSDEEQETAKSEEVAAAVDDAKNEDNAKEETATKYDDAVAALDDAEERKSAKSDAEEEKATESDNDAVAALDAVEEQKATKYDDDDDAVFEDETDAAFEEVAKSDEKPAKEEVVDGPTESSVTPDENPTKIEISDNDESSDEEEEEVVTKKLQDITDQVSDSDDDGVPVVISVVQKPEPEEWEVERIVDYRCDKDGNVLEYEIKWKNWDATHNTLEKAKGIHNSIPDMVFEYWDSMNVVKPKNLPERVAVKVSDTDTIPYKRRFEDYVYDKEEEKPKRKSKRARKSMEEHIPKEMFDLGYKFPKSDFPTQDTDWKQNIVNLHVRHSRIDPDILHGFVEWSNEKKTIHDIETLHEKIPDMLLAYYESKLYYIKNQ